jgi:GTP-binding protein EngB required for normal cell division
VRPSGKDIVASSQPVASLVSDETLSRLQRLALAAGADHLAHEAGAAAERIRQEQLYVACLGQFKRGKSSLLNALVGHALLPTGVLPVTSVPTVLRYGAAGARVRTGTGWTAVPPERVADYVTEAENPGNRKGVELVEVLVPAPLLRTGVCLVDTPGLGSTSEANSATTRAFLPQIDAALIVLGADLPISDRELDLLKAIPEVPHQFFVLNKSDKVSESEAHQMAEFVRRVLREQAGRPGAVIYRVSALDRGGGPDWEALGQALAELAARQRESLLAGSYRRALARLKGLTVAWISGQLAALTRPVEESARRVRELGQVGAATERALLDLRPLFTGEEERLSREFALQAEAFVGRAWPESPATLRADWATGRFNHATRGETLEYANRLARSLVYPWLEEAETRAEAAYREAAGRFTAGLERQLERLASLANDTPTGFDPDGIGGFRVRRHFAFSDRMSYHYPVSPWPVLLDSLLPAPVRRRRRRRRAEAYLSDLLKVNASRVAGDLSERVRESRREAEAEIRERLRRLSQAAGSALERARQVQARGLDAIREEQARLETLQAGIEEIEPPAG